MISTILLVVGIAFLGVIVVTFFFRGTPVKDTRLLDADDRDYASGSELFTETFSILTNTGLNPGNDVEVLSNGDEVYPRLFEDLSSAEDLITWHVFWFKPGKLADRLADVLTERARAGVTVLFLYDAFGSMGVPKEYFDRLRQAGVEVAAFRPFRWNTLYKAQQRMHVRAVVIDTRVGYTGGFAISDEWLGDGRHEDQWRDTSVRVRGPLVNQLQASFAANWAEATGQLLVGDRVFDLNHGDPPGDVTAGLLYDAPSLGSTNAERFFMLTIEAARRTLFLTNAYFVPDRHFRNSLVQAVERGVDVRILTPGPNTDRRSTFYAARNSYPQLLEGGVKLYHYRPTMVHAKTVVADGVWSSVGTINFDNRSMVLNDEVAVVCRDERVGAFMERRFMVDLEYADPVTMDDLRGRGAFERVRDRLYCTVAPFL